MLTASFMVLEHIPMQMMDRYEDYDDDPASSTFRENDAVRQSL